MHPSYEVSTNQGSYMRATCARVLAAALMTGAIAAALAGPALFDAPKDHGFNLTAPPSSHRRLVRVPALPAPRRTHRVERIVVALSIRHQAPRPVAVRPAKGVTPPQASPPPDTRALESTPPPPPPAPAPATSAPAPSQDDSSACKEKSHGNGKAKGHCKDKKAPDETAATPPPPTVDQQPPAAPGQEQNGSGDQGHGHGHGKGKDNGED